MARIAGVDLPKHKRIEIALTYIYGLGLSSSQKILEKANVHASIRCKDLSDEQKDEFKKISPLSKIPVIVDHKNKRTVFESGAILIYLAELSGKFYNSEERLEIKKQKLKTN